jgi:hypothetical protein
MIDTLTVVIPKPGKLMIHTLSLRAERGNLNLRSPRPLEGGLAMTITPFFIDSGQFCGPGRITIIGTP